MDNTDKRNDDRLPVLWTGTLTTEDDKEYSCEVRDISHAGTLISCTAPLKMEDRILLEIEGLGEFAAAVKWQGSAQIGLSILAGPDLLLKKFAEGSGAEVSQRPISANKDPLADN
ncbi:MAG: PilZ domain-containing protein [Kordiimonadaceae bacterium]|nr:PilZ domain-containing protein [Kordiimonadaceae bacterium]